MATVYVISDTHFGHASMLKFETSRGTKMRNFSSVEEMDETMIERWNSVVRVNDHVYHLGDVAMKKDSIERILPRLNGHKRLVRGNHDIYSTKFYSKYFGEIYGVRVFEKMMLTHVPIHPLSVKPGWLNCHGHLHSNLSDTPLTLQLGVSYFNASAEVLNYVPITLEQIRAMASKW